MVPFGRLGYIREEEAGTWEGLRGHCGNHGTRARPREPQIRPPAGQVDTGLPPNAGLPGLQRRGNSFLDGEEN